MAVVRSFTDAFQVVDYTEEVTNVPNAWGTINQLGLFGTESVTQHVVMFEETTKDGALIIDRVRGDKAPVGKSGTRKIHTFAVPHFPYDDAISPQDLQGQRAYGNTDATMQLATIRTAKMERIRQNHAWTLEFARAQAITQGTVYAPSGTVSQNWNTEFGVTRKTVDFLLGTAGTEVNEKINEAIQHILLNANGTSMTGTVVLASTEFFSKLIKHASVKTAYQYYSSTQEPARTRLGGAMAMHREFVHGGTRFVEMLDTYNGQALIPAGKAYMVPTGTDVFKTYFSPANRIGLVNTLGEEVYLFESADAKGTKIELESESNHVSALLAPQLVVELSSSN